jgi:hypothetical protein
MADPKVTRRDTLRLATAVSALGVGLGVTMDAKAAGPTTVTLKRGDISGLSLNFLKWEPAAGYQTITSTDLSGIVQSGVNMIAMKLTFQKHGATDQITLHELKLNLQ